MNDWLKIQDIILLSDLLIVFAVGFCFVVVVVLF